MENQVIVYPVLKKNKCSFSLIEVLIFVTIASLFFVSVAVITTAALRDMRISEHKIVATRYAEELLSWLKVEKEDNWTNFANLDLIGGTTGTTYCYSDLESPILHGCNNIYSFGSPQTYLREAILTVDNLVEPKSVNIKIEVKWIENGSVLTVPINTILSIWQ